jgi:hypothetical protein
MFTFAYKGTDNDRSDEMDFQKPLDELEERVSKVKTSVSAATAETNEQLKAHAASAHDNAERELDEAKQHASAAADRTRTGWEQARADAKARAAELKTKARIRREQHDASVAASDADLAEAEAAAAIDYAAWTVEAAELAILDALYLRARANEKAAAVEAGA